MTDSTGQITALMHNYCELFDTGRFDEFAAQPVFAGRYRDQFTRSDGCWQWTRREVIGDLYGDVSHHVW